MQSPGRLPLKVLGAASWRTLMAPVPGWASARSTAIAAVQVQRKLFGRVPAAMPIWRVLMSGTAR